MDNRINLPRDDLRRHVDAARDRLIALSDRIWGIPETCYAEHLSAAEHASELEHQGFRVARRIAGIPTAVMGEAGEGGPVIAFLGEYDALPGLSQEAGATRPIPVEQGGNGHGCGHNLLGSASLLAAVAVRNWLRDNHLPGRVRYYGCPAEEGGTAKTFMVRAGLFADVDVAISWHPHYFWEVTPPLSLANTRVDFIFEGRASHAAASPELGRSALDAVELMNVGCNYLREHMPSDARIHYAIIDGGGIAPNVVQAHARVRYSVRARDLAGMKELLARVCKVAEGAAMMTETSVRMEILSAMSNLLGNAPLERTLQRVMEQLGPPVFDAEDRAFADAIRATMSAQDVESAWRAIGQADTGAALADFTTPEHAKRRPMIGSTDVGDVSWVVPTVQAHAPTFAIGTPFHSWQMVAQGKTAYAHKAMTHVAKALAEAGAAAFAEPGLIEEAKADLAARTAKLAYECPIPDDVDPPLAMSQR